MNPATEACPELSQTTRVKDFLEEMGRAVEGDITDRGTWVDWQDYMERRRYCQEFRDPQYPWPGSSDIVMPLIDKVMKKVAPRFFETLLGDRPVNAESIDTESHKNSGGVELFMGHLLQSRETRALQQWAYHLDDLNQHGWACAKSMWCYKAGPTPLYVTREKLPQSLQQMIPARTEEEADQIFAAAQARGMQAAILSPKEFKANAESVKVNIAAAFGLDPKRKRDQKAIDEIFAWFGDGARGSMTTMGSATFINQPGLVAVSPYDLIFPENTVDIQDAERVTHRMRVGTSQLLRLAHANDWEMSVVMDAAKAAMENAQKTNTYEADQINQASERARYHLPGIAEHEEHVLYEIYTWFAEKEFGDQKRISYIVHKDYMDRPLKVRVWNRPSGRIPFHITKLENSSRRVMGSRGIPEQLSDIDAEVTLNHRAKQNRAQIATSPSFAYRPGSGFNPEGVRWIPGAFYPVQRPGMDVMPLPVPPMDATEEREEAILRTWAEEYTGASDFGSQNALSSLTEARTAREISAIESNASLSALIAGSTFGQTVEEVCDEWFDMYHSFGPEELWIARTGKEPMQISKADLTGNFKFSMSAAINSGGPRGRAQRAMQRLGIVLQGQLQQQIGDKYELDVGELIREWLELDDPRTAARVLRQRTPQEIQQLQAQRQRMEEMIMKAKTNTAQTPEEMEEVVNFLQKEMPHGKLQQVDLSQMLS